MPAVIELRYGARCLDCGADLEPGTKARYYGRGRVYGLECHARQDVAEQAGTELAETGRPEPEKVETAGPVTEKKVRRPATKKKVAPSAPAGSFDAAALKVAVAKVTKGISNRPGIPALTGILIECGADRTILTATDLEMTIRAEIPTNGHPSGWSALVPGRLLKDALKGWPSTTIQLETDGSAMRLLHDGAELTTFRCLALEDFPKVAEPDGPSYLADVESFTAAVGAVEPHASKDEARPVLTGILIEASADGMTLAASDSYTLATAELGAEGRAEASALVPARVLKSLAMFGKRQDGAVVIVLGETQVGFTLPDGTIVVSRTIDEQFPNYRQLIPEEAGNVLTFDPTAMLAATGRAGLLARESSPVRLELDPTFGARITSSSPDLGGHAEMIDGTTYEGEALTVAYNADYLARTIRSAAGTTLELRDGLKPALARGDGRMSLLMPVRIPAAVG